MTLPFLPWKVALHCARLEKNFIRVILLVDFLETPGTCGNRVYIRDKLAHIQVIEWILWCLWTVTTLVFAYAFFLGIVTPLISAKRGSSKFNSVRIGNSATIPSNSVLCTTRYSVASQLQVSTKDSEQIFLQKGLAAYRQSDVRLF